MIEEDVYLFGHVIYNSLSQIHHMLKNMLGKSIDQRNHDPIGEAISLNKSKRKVKKFCLQASATYLTFDKLRK